MPFSLAEFSGIASPKEQKDFSLDAFAGVTPEQKQGNGFSLDAFAGVPKSKIDSAIDWIGEKAISVKDTIDSWTSPVPDKAIQEEWKNQPINANDSTLAAAGKGVATYFKAGVPLHSVLGVARGAVELPVEALTAQMTGDVNKQAEIVKGLFDFIGRPTGVKDLVRGWVEEGKLVPEKFSEFEEAWTKDPFGSVMAVIPFVKGGIGTAIKTAKGIKKGYVGEVISDAVQKEGQGGKVTSPTLSKEEPKVIQEKDYINDVTLGELQNIVAKGGDATAHVYEGLKEGKITQEQAIEVRTKALTGALDKAKTEAEKNRIWENVKVEADNMQDVIENYKPPVDILLKQAEAKKVNPVEVNISKDYSELQKEKPIQTEIPKDLGEIKNRLSKPAFELYQKNIADVGQDMFGDVSKGGRAFVEGAEKTYDQIGVLAQASTDIRVRRDARKIIKILSDQVYDKYKNEKLQKILSSLETPKDYTEYNIFSDFLKNATQKEITPREISQKLGKPIPPEVLKDYPELHKPIDYEPFVKGGATGELPKYAEGSAINLEKLDTTNDVKQFINQRTKDLEQKIGKKTVTWEETRAKAESMGLDWKDAVKHSKSIEHLAAWVEATRELQTTMGKTVFDKIKNLPADKTLRTPEMKMDILNDIASHGEVLTATSRMSSEIGRALNVHKKMMADNPEFMQNVGINKILEGIGKKGNLEKEFDNIIKDFQSVDLNNPTAVNKVLQKYYKANVSDMILEGWKSALISAPTTHAVNILSNTLALLSKPLLETPTASLLESLKPPFGKQRQVFWGEVPAEAVGAWQGMKEGVRSAVKSFKTGMPSDMWNKAETPRFNAIPGKTGEVIRLPLRALTAADEFFKSVVYQMELNKQAYSIAVKEGLKDKARVNKMADLLENPTPEMMEKSYNAGLYRTFNKPLGEIGNTLMKARAVIPYNLGHFLVPFMRTVANIAKFTLERTPLNFAKIAKDYKQGEITPKQLSSELAKPIVGSLMGIATVMLVKEGLITGGGPKDKIKREALYRTGWQPYSFVINGNYYGFNRLEPLGSIVGMAADFGEMSYSTEDEKLNDLAGRIALSFGKNITSKTFMKSVSGMLDALSDPERYGDNFVKQYTGTLIPSLVASVANATDPVLRQKNNPLETIKSRIPVVSERLLPKRDLWGAPIEKSGSSMSRLLSPIPFSKAKADKIDKEMLRLGLDIGMPQKKIMGIELSPEEYDSFVTIAGQTAKKKLDLIVNSPSWDNKPEESKARLIKGIIEAERKVASIKILRTKDKEEVKAKIKENRKLVKTN